MCDKYLMLFSILVHALITQSFFFFFFGGAKGTKSRHSDNLRRVFEAPQAQGLNFITRLLLSAYNLIGGQWFFLDLVLYFLYVRLKSGLKLVFGSKKQEETVNEIHCSNPISRFRVA